MRNTQLLFIILSALAFAQPMHAASAPVEERPIEMPALKVTGSFSEVSWAAKFRYHIPGNALKSLVFTELPNSWLKQGISKGDILEAIDGVPIDGRKLPVVVQQLESKRNSEAPILLEVRSKSSNKVQKIEVTLKKDSSNLVIHYP